MVALTLLWSMVLLCKIQFGKNVVVTRLTFKPYVFALFFLVVQFVESISLLIQERTSSEEPALIVRQHIFSRWTVGFLSVKFVLFYAFVVTQTFEN